MSEQMHHPDVLSPSEAVDYLRLDEACESPEAARRLLNRLCQSGDINPLEWGKTRLFSRRILDDFVNAEVAALNGSAGRASDEQTDGKPPVKRVKGRSAPDGTPDAPPVGTKKTIHGTGAGR